MISSLFLTLVIVPVIYQIAYNIQAKFGWNKKTTPMEELMVEDYDHIDVHEYDIKH